MAVTPKLLTERTAIFAAVLVGLLLASAWAVVELLPDRPLVLPEEIELEPTPPPRLSTAPHAELDTPFHPGAHPDDPRRCAELRDAVVATWLDSKDAAAVASLIDDYMSENCPSAVHQGDWRINAQILGVGTVFEAARGEMPAGAEPDRATHLQAVAASTFAVINPESMCFDAFDYDPAEASLDEAGPTARTIELEALVERCKAAFR